MDNIVKVFRFLLYKLSEIRNGKGKTLIGKDAFYTLFRLITHPIDAFNDVKYEHKESLTLANLMAVLFFLIRLLAQSGTGYLFARPEDNRAGFWTVLATSIGLLAVWGICNWAACTLFDGEGTFREIWIMTCYSLLPYLLMKPCIVLLSHAISQDETVVITVLGIIAVGWTLILAFLGMLVCQQFTVFKTVMLAIVTALGIFALLFLMLLFFSISQQIVGFVKNLFMEIFL